MAKAKTTAFFCSECGYESSKWMGQCPACKAWNTLVEEPTAGSARSASPSGRLSAVSGIGAGKREKAALLSEISLEEEDRISTGFKELDRVLGDGIVAGSLILVGGDPGIGKSTLLLQVCRQLAADGKKVLYISGEESLKQIKMRACRIGSVTGDLRFLCETNLDRISQAIDLEKPQIVVIDSIQTMYNEEVTSAPGSVSQREIFLAGHSLTLDKVDTAKEVAEKSYKAMMKNKAVYVVGFHNKLIAFATRFGSLKLNRKVAKKNC